MTIHRVAGVSLSIILAARETLRSTLVAQSSALGTSVSKLSQWWKVDYMNQWQLDLAQNNAYNSEVSETASARDILSSGFLLMAVPKRKTTPSRRKVRQHDKYPQNIQNVSRCHQCGEAKLLHALCWPCTKKVLIETANIRRLDPAFTKFHDKTPFMGTPIKKEPFAKDLKDKDSSTPPPSSTQ
eukprot:CFRG4661T1